MVRNKRNRRSIERHRRNISTRRNTSKIELRHSMFNTSRWNVGRRNTRGSGTAVKVLLRSIKRERKKQLDRLEPHMRGMYFGFEPRLYARKLPGYHVKAMKCGKHSALRRCVICNEYETCDRRSKWVICGTCGCNRVGDVARWLNDKRESEGL
jgi:hypothetical protein